MDFVTKYQDSILGINSGFDRVVITGSLTPISFEKGVRRFLSANNILLKQFQTYAKFLAEDLKEHAKLLAESENVPYIYLNNSKTRKEELIKSILKERGNHPGLIAVLTSLELCNSFDVHKNKSTHKLELIARQRKCLHIYFYFIDEQLGHCYFRIQTFFPFKVQIYFNGRDYLARKLDKESIGYQKDDNCFTWISDFNQAQKLADDIDVSRLQSLFDGWAQRYVPILSDLTHEWNLSYHWSIKQIEYAKDIVFTSEQSLDEIYRQFLQQLTLSVMPEDIMSFLGKKLKGPQAGRIDTSMKKTYLGYRIKHRNGNLSIKAYNKSGNVLRIEITINNISEFKIYREVERRDGQTTEKRFAPMKKSIYSLEHVIRIGKAATDRYIDYLSKMEDNNVGVKELRQLTERKTKQGKTYKGFNPLNQQDSKIFQILLDGALITTGFKNHDLRSRLTEHLSSESWNTTKVSRLIRLLKSFGLLRKVHGTYRYFLTKKARLLFALAVKLRNLLVIPTVDNMMKKMCLV
jgi:hypothetical protein